MLTLEVELLTSVYRAGTRDGSAAEWPPHPERVFSALVQAWGDGGRNADEQQALEWLETLPPPEIEATDDDDLGERTAPTVYVPPNDTPGDKLEVLPERRKRQARTFRALAPTEPLLRFRWQVEPSPRQKSALDSLAHRVASLGHSASLVRFHFGDTASDLDSSRTWVPDPEGMVSLRAPYPGRLADLERWFHAEQRPHTRYTVSYRPPSRAAPSSTAVESVFGGPNNWFVFEDAGGFRPDLSGIAHVSRRLRDALMSVSRQPVAEIISGHGPDGNPSTRPHLAIVPLANVGWEWSTGELLGVAVVLPRSVEPDERRIVVEALAKLVRFRGDGAEAILQISRQHQWVLERVAAPSRASLMPGRWCQQARTWASATPVILDRFPDRDDPIEEAQIVAAACRNIGLPEPLEIEIHKHSTLKGAPPAYGRRHARGRAADWSFPRGSKLADRLRCHIVLRFGEMVRGPVLLGAGRFHGFGLCLPIDPEEPR